MQHSDNATWIVQVKFELTKQFQVTTKKLVAAPKSRSTEHEAVQIQVQTQEYMHTHIHMYVCTYIVNR